MPQHSEPFEHKRFWKLYRTESGHRVVREYIFSRPEHDRARILAEMEIVREEGKKAARHVRGDIYEVRVTGKDVIYRVLFATEGRYNQVCLAVHAFDKKTRKTDPNDIDLAEKRLSDWRWRGISDE
jgi:phage-related protein